MRIWCASLPSGLGPKGRSRVGATAVDRPSGGRIDFSIHRLAAPNWLLSLSLSLVTATCSSLPLRQPTFRIRLIYETQDREAGTEDLLGGVQVHDLDCYERVGVAADR